MSEEEARIMIGAEVNKAQIPAVLGIVMAAYSRGRREAIEEAVKVLGEWTGDQVVIDGFARQMRTGHGFSGAAAELNAKGPARGQ